MNQPDLLIDHRAMRWMACLLFSLTSVTAWADSSILYSINGGDFVRPLAKIEGGRFVQFDVEHEIEAVGASRPTLLSFDTAKRVVVRHRIARATPSESPPDACGQTPAFISLATKTNARLLSTGTAIKALPGLVMPTSLGRQLLLQLTPEYVGHRATPDAEFSSSLLTFSGQSFVLPKISNKVHVVQAFVAIDRTQAAARARGGVMMGAEGDDHSYPRVPLASAEISDGALGDGSLGFERLTMRLTLVVDETPSHEFKLRFFHEEWAGGSDQDAQAQGAVNPTDAASRYLAFADLNGDGQPELVIEAAYGNFESDGPFGSVLVLERAGADWKKVSEMSFGDGC